MSKFVAYYRVSTAKQGASGLGLDAQRKAVLQHVGQATLVEEFTEVESGKNNQRPQLEAALRHARVTGSTLIVAKLDRLSRNAAFLNTLFDSGQAVCFADMPFADKLTIGIMAQLAEWERDQISQRTKEALQAAKRKGRKLGGKRSPKPIRTTTGQARSVATRQAQAASRKQDFMHYVDDARAAGATTLQAIADHMNKRGVSTARGGKWYPASVGRLLAE